MCGISCLIYKNCENKRDLHNVFEKSQENIKRRGPDSFHSLVFKTNDYTIKFTASVLWLQGEKITPQPLETDHSIFIYNGDIFNTNDHEESTRLKTGDTRLFLNILESECDFVAKLERIHGPYSFIYLDKQNLKLYFTRDFYGRRSLLLGKSANTLMISSVTVKNQHDFIELPPIGVFCMDLATGKVIVLPWKCNNVNFDAKVEAVENCLRDKILISNEHTMCKIFNSFKEPDASEMDVFNDIKKLEPFDALQFLLDNADWSARVEQLKTLLREGVRKRIQAQPGLCSNCLNARCDQDKFNCVDTVDRENVDYKLGTVNSQIGSTTVGENSKLTLSNKNCMPGLCSNCLNARCDQDKFNCIYGENFDYKLGTVSSQIDSTRVGENSILTVPNKNCIHCKDAKLGVDSAIVDEYSKLTVSNESCMHCKHAKLGIESATGGENSKLTVSNESCSKNSDCKPLKLGIDSALEATNFKLKESCLNMHCDLAKLGMDSAIEAKYSKLNESCLKNMHCNHAKLGILFSGGLDCSILALLADSFLDPDESIDLMNVAFSGPHGYKTPDRISGLETLEELKQLRPNRLWNFMEIDIMQEELNEARDSHIKDLIYPLNTILDDSLGCALWFASRGAVDGYVSPCRVILVGMGADELFGGYTRHRAALKKSGWSGLWDSMREDWMNISHRNLARDDRIVSDHGRQLRTPYLDENVVEFVLSLNVWEKTYPSDKLVAGLGEKILLRALAYDLGLRGAACLKKRALQFGSRIADKKEKAHEISPRL